jgi:DNA-binding transcriptional MerR regulator
MVSMVGRDGYTVGTLGKLSGVSVRTLHHYDEIGLLVPSDRTPAGYRLYSPDDLSRLRQVLFYRELGFALDEIAKILADPAVPVDDHLRRQHRMLRERRERDQALLQTIEHEMEVRKMGMSLTPEEQLEVFGTTKYAEHVAEAEQRWGETDQWRESQRRSAAYTKEDWVEIKAQADANIAAFAEAIRAGEPADGPIAMDLAEAHRTHIARWFYRLDHDQHRGLGDLYTSDARYYEPYEQIAPGFSQYVRDAIHANADRART